MTDFGEAFSWMTKDPEWVGKLIIVGLIGIIPIVGQMNLLGWTLASADNLRNGRYELAPANFSNLGRGAMLFVALLVWSLPLLVVASVFYVPGVVLTVANPNSGVGAIGGLLTGLGGLVVFVLGLGYAWLQPVIYVRFQRGGLGAAMNFGAALADLRAQPMKTLLAALLFYVGSLIGGIGFLACLIGAIFTVPFGYAIVAGVLRVYEQQVSPAVPQPI